MQIIWMWPSSSQGDKSCEMKDDSQEMVTDNYNGLRKLHLYAVLGKLLCQCNILHITLYFWAM